MFLGRVAGAARGVGREIRPSGWHSHNDRAAVLAPEERNARTGVRQGRISDSLAGEASRGMLTGERPLQDISAFQSSACMPQNIRHACGAAELSLSGSGDGKVRQDKQCGLGAHCLLQVTQLHYYCTFIPISNGKQRKWSNQP